MSTTLPSSIDAIKRANAQHGGHFFDASTMRFFNSRVLPTVHVGTTRSFFVTSEQYDDQTPRLYTVRYCDAAGDVATVGEFQGIETPAKAQRVAAALADIDTRTAAALEQARDAFWSRIAVAFPEVTSGDFGPDSTIAWETATRRAVTAWLEDNHPVLSEIA